MKDIRQRLLATFHIEHAEHVKKIRETMSAFQAAGGAPVAADLDEIFRRAHSLKGAARAVDLRPIEQLAHRLETLFARLREGALTLDKAVIKVICLVLDASEDWLGLNGGSPREPVEAVAAIQALLDGTADSHGSADPVVTAGPKPPSSVAPPIPSPRPSPAPAIDVLRLNAESLDRIMSSAGELLTETLHQTDVTEQLRQMTQLLSDTATERDRLRASGALVFQKLDATPELATAVRYAGYLDHQMHLLSKQVGTTVQLQRRNAWTLRTLAGELQRNVRQARMVPAENVFDGFRKMVRDLARDSGKTVELHMAGLHLEADRIVLQALKDPVMHMLRNAVSHGLETAAERASKGKPPEGRIDLAVDVRGSRLHITVEDDGRGVDVHRVSEVAIRNGLLSESAAAARSRDDLMRLVLLPGFSTARAVTDISGRGMGLSVVAQAVARLQGTVDIGAGTRGGTRITLSAPLSVASHRVMLVACQGRTYAMPLHGIERLRRVKLTDIQTVESSPVINIEGELVPVVSLARLLNDAAEPQVSAQGTLCVMDMRAGSRRLAVAVDAFLSERSAIIKDLPAPARGPAAIAGGIVLEDGSVCLVLNPSALLEGFRPSAQGLVLAETPAADLHGGQARDASAGKPLEILVVDDSLTTRTLEKSVLEAHGYQVAIAVDGVDALKYLRTNSVGLVISDLEMPRLDGFGLLAEIKRDPRLTRIPVIIVSSIESPDEQARGLTLGADAYIVKRKFEQQELLDTIRQIL